MENSEIYQREREEKAKFKTTCSESKQKTSKLIEKMVNNNQSTSFPCDISFSASTPPQISGVVKISSITLEFMRLPIILIAFIVN